MVYASGVGGRRAEGQGRSHYCGRAWRMGRALAGQLVGLRLTATDGVFEVLVLTHVIKELDLRQNLTPPVPQP